MTPFLRPFLFGTKFLCFHLFLNKWAAPKKQLGFTILTGDFGKVIILFM